MKWTIPRKYCDAHEFWEMILLFAMKMQWPRKNSALGHINMILTNNNRILLRALFTNYNSRLTHS